MAIDNKIKRAVAKEWIEFFPDLHLVTPQKLYKILGHCVVGIDIAPNGEWYGAYFVIHPLYDRPAGTDLKAILINSAIMINKPGGSLISYIEREEKCKIRPKQALKESFDVFLEGDITMSNFLTYIDERLFPLSYGRGDFVQLHLLKIFTALYIGDKKLAQELCNSLTVENTKWIEDHLSEGYSQVKNPFYHVPNIEAFRANIQSVIDNPGPMLATIEANKNDPKLKKLIRSEILPG